MDSYKKLYRQDGVIGGVCGGLAAYTGIDVVFWRILFLFLLLPGGLPGLLPYILMWVVIPPKPDEHPRTTAT